MLLAKSVLFENVEKIFTTWCLSLLKGSKLFQGFLGSKSFGDWQTMNCSWKSKTPLHSVLNFPAKMGQILALIKWDFLLWFANNVNRHRQNGENFMVRKVLKSQFCMLKFDKRLCFWHQSSRCYHRDERMTADKDERGQKTLLCVKSKSSHFLTNAAANPHFSNPPRACPIHPWACGMYPYFRDTYLTPLLFPNVTF